MKEGKVLFKYLENEADVEHFQKNNNGGFKFPVGTLVISGCIAGVDCHNLPFIPGLDGKSADEQFAEWFDDQMGIITTPDKKKVKK